MTSYLFFCCLALLAVSIQAFKLVELPEDIDEAIAHINRQQSSWKAVRRADSTLSWKQFKFVPGVLPLPEGNRLPERDDHHLRALGDDPLPESFSALDKWPECKSVMSNIRDQLNCGACWAFAAAECMSDRLCIHSRGRIQVELSPQDMLSCCDFCGGGCAGGLPEQAWEYWTFYGVVTGGDSHSNRGCRSYSLLPCKGEHCTSGTPGCYKMCDRGYSKPYSSDLHYGKTAYSIPSDEEDIMREIYINGPVEGTLTVYEDFKHYESGVYHHVSGKSEGGHAVRLVGWGVEGGEKYWLIANSWGTNWGLDGFGKILRGVNECGIEGRLCAGLPDLS